MPCARSGRPCLVTTLPEPGSDPVGLRAWWVVCAALALPALILHAALLLDGSQSGVPLNAPVASWPALAQALVMRPDAGLAQPPWVWWSTAWLHGSQAHLLRNLAGVLLLATLAWLMPPTRRTAAAWMLAWPLTHLGMLMEPTLSSYVGLSGVLHAGVVVLALSATGRHTPRPMRLCALALLAGTACKVIMENPWGHSLIASSASAINVAPWAHLSGCVAGVLSVCVVWATTWASPWRPKAVTPPQRDMI